jgi:hypothetical protein
MTTLRPPLPRRNELLYSDRRRCPAGRILVRLNPLVQVDDDGVTIPVDHVTVQVAGGGPPL